MTEMLPCSGGGQITLRPHALTHDGESVAVCNAERIRVYSASSGEYLYSLKGHQDEVTSVCSHPSLDQKVWNSCSCTRVHRCIFADWLIHTMLNAIDIINLKW